MNGQNNPNQPPPSQPPRTTESPFKLDDILFTKLSNLEINQRRNSNHSIHSNPNPNASSQSPSSLGLGDTASNTNFSPHFLPQLDNTNPVPNFYLNNQGFNNNLYLNTHPPFPNFSQNYQLLPESFNLPLELQGGIGTISSRRPSYAAESFTRSDATVPNLNLNGFDLNQSSAFKSDNKHSLATLAAVNNFNNQQTLPVDQFNDSFLNFNLNANLTDFQQRRPSQLATYLPPTSEKSPVVTTSAPATGNQLFNPSYLSQPTNGEIKLENGLILRDQYIVASPDLKCLYMKTIKYFQDVELCEVIILNLKNLLNNEVIIKLITFIKNLNNLNFNHKMLCLVVNKNGKFDLLSYPNNSNIFLQKNDLVIVDGDRGKDMVMILEPLLNLNFAILFNFLKKFEHLKSLTIFDNNQQQQQQQQHAPTLKKSHSGGTHSTSVNASYIINSHSNEDNEFIITLPTKQVLKFATPKEVHKISGKFLEEKKAFTTCYNKVKELNLNNDLELINVEYQSDFKKLIFYYYANFKRIDFRGLIKELFKIYKTRIWLCAVLPCDKPELYTIIPSKESSGPDVVRVPREYELSNEQILNFSINEFDNLAKPNYFHLKNLLNLVEHLKLEIKGNFYGFNSPQQQQRQQQQDHHHNQPQKNSGHHPQAPANILPSFNPFGDSN